MTLSTNRPLKVDDILSMLSTSSLQEICNCFVSIVNRIFSTDNSDSYWDIITRHKTRSDYDKIVHFLSPNGQLMELILKRLTIDKSIIHYEFPVNRLSIFTQTLILNNSAPSFISSKLAPSKTHGFQQAVLYLNAFEYFIFSFFNYISHPNSLKKIDWNGATDSIYCQLVLRYFDFFLFNTRESCCLMPLALQTRSRSGCLNQSFSRAPLLSSPSSLQSVPRFIKTDWSGVSTSTSGNRDSKQTPESIELFYTETFIQTVIEFWLNSTMSLSNMGGQSALGRLDSSRQSDNVDLVCLVRLFVKHCYHFSFRRAIRFLEPGCQIEYEFVSKLNFYRQQLVPKLLLPKIFFYLQSCFQTWPVDLTFKIVMETWLSAVQPWRYVDSYQHPNDHDISVNMGSSVRISEEWTEFVQYNFELYSNLLLQFTRRLLRMDLAVVRNAHMLFRVAKVLNQPILIHILNAEHDSRITKQMESDWGNIRTQLALVFMEIDSVIERIDSSNDCSDRSWWHTVWDYFNSDSMSSNSQKRVVALLRQSQASLSELLMVHYESNIARAPRERNDYLEHKNRQPEHIVTSKGVRLTEFGRFQVANRLCQLNFTSNIDYYHQPICSFEIAPLVKLGARVSNAFCGRYNQQLRTACYRPDFCGRLSRYLLIGERRPKTRTESDSEERDGIELQNWVDEHPLNVRLRVLATKAFLFWFLVLLFICKYLFDVGALSMVTGGAMAYLLAAIFYVAVTGFE